MPDSKKSALEYLRQNKDKFPLEVLRKKLIEAGYPQDQIEEGIRIVYGGQIPSPSAVASSLSFWDFRNVRVYRTAGQKVIDALFGFFVVPFVVGIPFTLLFVFSGFSYGFRSSGDFGFVNLATFAPFVIQIALIFYFWQKRRYLAYGLTVSVILGSLRWLPFFYSF